MGFTHLWRPPCHTGQRSAGPTQAWTGTGCKEICKKMAELQEVACFISVSARQELITVCSDAWLSTFDSLSQMCLCNRKRCIRVPQGAGYRRGKKTKQPPTARCRSALPSCLLAHSRPWPTSRSATLCDFLLLQGKIYSLWAAYPLSAGQEWTVKTPRLHQLFHWKPLLNRTTGRPLMSKARNPLGMWTLPLPSRPVNH